MTHELEVAAFRKSNCKAQQYFFGKYYKKKDNEIIILYQTKSSPESLVVRMCHNHQLFAFIKLQIVQENILWKYFYKSMVLSFCYVEKVTILPLLQIGILSTVLYQITFADNSTRPGICCLSLICT